MLRVRRLVERSVGTPDIHVGCSRVASGCRRSAVCTESSRTQQYLLRWGRNDSLGLLQRRCSVLKRYDRSFGRVSMQDCVRGRLAQCSPGSVVRLSNARRVLLRALAPHGVEAICLQRKHCEHRLVRFDERNHYARLPSSRTSSCDLETSQGRSTKLK